MNIFVLDEDPVLAAQYHCDKHVVKMITESVQLLSSAYYFTGQEHLAPYRLSHAKHPCAIWARTSWDNWAWLCILAGELYKEYKFRYGSRLHRAGELVPYLANNQPNLPSIGYTPHPLCMPEDCKISSSPVECYREYYRRYKQHILYYRHREKPYWLKEYDYDSTLSDES